jgi:hypothetical protein
VPVRWLICRAERLRLFGADNLPESGFDDATECRRLFGLGEQSLVGPDDQRRVFAYLEQMSSGCDRLAMAASSIEV